MSILQFTANELLNSLGTDSESDSDSDYEDEITHKQEHERRKLSVLLKHDEVAYNNWLEVSHHYTFLSEMCSLHEQQINILTQQTEVLSEDNTRLYQENETIRNAFDESEQNRQDVLTLLTQIQHELANDATKNTLVYKIQEFLTKDAINKHGYV